MTAGNGVSVGGWRIQTKTTPILGREALEALEARLGTSHLPEMVYGSALELTHLASGTRLHFNAEDALKEWLEEGLPPLKVAAAAEWAKGHKLRFGDERPPPASKPITATTGDGHGGGSGGAGLGSGRDEDTGVGAGTEGKPGWDKTESHEDYDWTFTSPYRGTLDTDPSSAAAREATAGAAGDVDGAAAAAAWEVSEERVDRSMLMARDPILFFDELTLYESELDDNGEMSMSLKVRVMPRCWFILMRFWMRVDGVLLRLRETRLFCRMTPPPTLPPGLSEEKRAALAASLAANATASGAAAGVVVVRESARREETFQALAARGAPHLPAQYPDADEAAAVLLAAGGPVDVAYHALKL